MAMPRLTNTPAWRSAASSCPSASARKAGRDTSGVTSAGPLFNRNRPAIKTDEATRVALHAQYEVNLADARNSAEALGQSIALLQRQSMQADQAAAQAVSIAANARRAFVAGGLDARAETDLIIAAGQRQREGIQLCSQLQTAKLSLAVLLGLGLPVHD